MAQNITELIWNEELCGLLRLCGAEEREIGATASDYEKFRATCHAIRLLAGHSLPMRLAAILSRYFRIETPISANTCDEIWKKTADMLLYHPISQEEIAVASVFDREQPSPVLQNRLSLSAAFPATLFVRTRSESVDAWMREIESVLRDANLRGCQTLFFGLPAVYSDRKPDLYHVDLVLHQPKKVKTDLDLLYAQMMRSVSQICQRLGIKLLFRAECEAEDAVTLLSRVEREVGLPPVIWTTPREDTRNALIEWSKARHENEVIAALTQSDYADDAALLEATAQWACRYPVGRLQLLTT